MVASPARGTINGSTLTIYSGGTHSLGDTSKEQLNADLLAFIRG